MDHTIPLNEEEIKKISLAATFLRKANFACTQFLQGLEADDPLRADLSPLVTLKTDTERLSDIATAVTANKVLDGDQIADLYALQERWNDDVVLLNTTLMERASQAAAESQREAKMASSGRHAASGALAHASSKLRNMFAMLEEKTPTIAKTVRGGESRIEGRG